MRYGRSRRGLLGGMQPWIHMDADAKEGSTAHLDCCGCATGHERFSSIPHDVTMDRHIVPLLGATSSNPMSEGLDKLGFDSRGTPVGIGDKLDSCMLAR